jgi:hypothetical protein
MIAKQIYQKAKGYRLCKEAVDYDFNYRPLDDEASKEK